MADVGRPKETDLKQMAKELIEWSYLPDSLNLIGFSSPRRMSVTKLPHYASIDNEFREALSLAKENISQNRFNAANAELMPSQFFTRCEGMYDPLYHKYDRDNKTFESKLRKDEEGAKQSTYNITVPHDLAIGANLSASPVSDKGPASSK